MGAAGKKIPRWQRIDVNSPKRRRIWLSIATVLIVVSIISIAVKGLNLGIDFEGGSQVSFETAAPTSVERGPPGRGRRSFRRTPSSRAAAKRSGGDYSSFQIRTESLAQAEQERLQQTLERELDAEVAGIRNVSGSFSSQIARGSIIAIVVSFVLISIYITFRFQWRFAVPILRTLFNDILITLGVYSLSGRELTTATVAAVLTILGYSIYDTIIIFDRVRENMPLMRRSSFAAIANQSLWETIRRSMATTFVTLLPIGSLLFFGGDTLKDFAFALLVGNRAGCYLDRLRRDAVPDRPHGAHALSTLREGARSITRRSRWTPGPSRCLPPGPRGSPACGGVQRVRSRLGTGVRGVVRPRRSPSPPKRNSTRKSRSRPRPTSPPRLPRRLRAPPTLLRRREARRKRRRSRPHGRAR